MATFDDNVTSGHLGIGHLDSWKGNFWSYFQIIHVLNPVFDCLPIFGLEFGPQNDEFWSYFQYMACLDTFWDDYLTLRTHIWPTFDDYGMFRPTFGHISQLWHEKVLFWRPLYRQTTKNTSKSDIIGPRVEKLSKTWHLIRSVQTIKKSIEKTSVGWLPLTGRCVLTSFPLSAQLYGGFFKTLVVGLATFGHLLDTVWHIWQLLTTLDNFWQLFDIWTNFSS